MPTLRSLRVLIDFIVQNQGLKQAQAQTTALINQATRMGAAVDAAGVVSAGAFTRMATSSSGAAGALIGGLRGVQTQVRSWRDSLSNSITGLEAFKQKSQATADAIKQHWLGLGLAFTAVTGLVGLSIRAAGEEERMWRRFNLVLGDNANAVKAWADAYANSIGKTVDDVATGAVSIGAIVSNFGLSQSDAVKMTKDLTRATFDLSSVMGQNFETSLLEVQQAMAGRSTALQRMGLQLDENSVKEWAVSQGYIKQGEALDTVQTRMFTVKKLLEDVGKKGITGDMERTVGTFEGGMRKIHADLEDFQKSMGKDFRTLFNPVVHGLGAFLHLLNQFPVMGHFAAGALLLAGALTGIPLVFLALNKGLSLWIDGLKVLRVALNFVQQGFGQFALGLMRANQGMNGTGTIAEGLGRSLGMLLNWVKGLWTTLSTVATKAWAAYRAQLAATQSQTLGLTAGTIGLGGSLKALIATLWATVTGARAASVALAVLATAMKATVVLAAIMAVFWAVQKLIDGLKIAWGWLMRVLGIDKSKTADQLEKSRQAFLNWRLELAKAKSTGPVDTSSLEEAQKKAEEAQIKFAMLPASMRDAISQLESQGFEGLQQTIQNNIDASWVTEMAKKIADKKQDVNKATQTLAQGIDDHLKTRSPAKAGPLRDVMSYGPGIVQAIVEGMKGRRSDLLNAMEVLLAPIQNAVQMRVDLESKIGQSRGVFQGIIERVSTSTATERIIERAAPIVGPMTGPVMPGLAPVTAGGPAVSFQPTINLQQVFNMEKGAMPEDLIAKIEDAGKEAGRRIWQAIEPFAGGWLINRVLRPNQGYAQPDERKRRQ